MSPPIWMSNLLGQRLAIAGVEKSPRSSLWNFVSGVTAVYNTSTGAWDLTVTGGGGGTGDFVGPASSIVDRLVLFADTTGKLGKQASFGISDLIKINGSAAFTADQPMGGHKLTGLAVGSATGHSVEYDQMNAAIAAGFSAAVSTLADWKQSVRLATTAALAASTLVGSVRTANANGALPTIDGVAPAVNDRILDKDHATGSTRGIYTITSLGSGGTPWVLTRASDFDASAEVTAGLTVAVTEGTANGPGNTNGGNVFMLTTPDPIVLNTTALTFSRIGTVAPDGVSIVVSGGVLVRGALSGAISASAGSNTTAFASGDFAALPVRTTDRFIAATSGTPTATADAGSFESCTTGSGSLRGLCHRQASADANGARSVLQKSRGTHASPAAVAAEDALGENISRSHDGSAFFDAGLFRHIADAAGGTSKRTRAQSQLHNGTALATVEDAVQHAQTTTDATLTVVRTIPLAADSVLRVTYGIVGAQNSSSNRAIRTTTVTLRRSGSGDPVVVAYSDSCPLFKDDGTWGSDTEIGHQINTTSDSLEIIVKGKAATTIVWTVDVQYGAR